MLFSIKKGDVITEIELVTESGAYGLPQFLVETEFIFLVNILCKASKERVVPYTVKMQEPVHVESLQDFFGVSVQQADRNSIVFCNADLEQPFISHDETMWEYLKPELSRCLAELEIDASMSAKVRSVLVKILAGGDRKSVV